MYKTNHRVAPASFTNTPPSRGASGRFTKRVKCEPDTDSEGEKEPVAGPSASKRFKGTSSSQQKEEKERVVRDNLNKEEQAALADADEAAIAAGFAYVARDKAQERLRAASAKVAAAQQQLEKLEDAEDKERVEYVTEQKSYKKWSDAMQKAQQRLKDVRAKKDEFNEVVQAYNDALGQFLED